MINTRQVMEKAFYIEDQPYWTKEELFEDAVCRVVQVLEKEGLTYMQAQEVLKASKKVLKREKLWLEHLQSD